MKPEIDENRLPVIDRAIYDLGGKIPAIGEVKGYKRNILSMLFSAKTNFFICTAEEFETRLRQLINVPNFEDHPDAKCFVQNADGNWYKNVLTTEIFPEIRFAGAWKVKNKEVHRHDLCCGWRSVHSGKIIGNDWTQSFITPRQKKTTCSKKEDVMEETNVDTQIDRLQKELNELKAQREAEKSAPCQLKPINFWELLAGGDYWLCFDDDLRESKSSPTTKRAGVEFANKETAERVAKGRLLRNRVEAWVEQEIRDGEARGYAVYKNNKGDYRTTSVGNEQSLDLGAVVMTERLANLFCDKVNSGEWIL